MFINVQENHAAERMAVLDLLRAEREKSVSIREWKHRLVGYGYSVLHTSQGDVVTQFGSTRKICEVPAELLH